MYSKEEKSSSLFKIHPAFIQVTVTPFRIRSLCRTTPFLFFLRKRSENSSSRRRARRKTVPKVSEASRWRNAKRKTGLSQTRTGVNQCNLHKSEVTERLRSYTDTPSDGMIYTGRASSRINKICIHFSWYVTTKLSIVNGFVDVRVSMRLVALAEIAKACKSRNKRDAQAQMFAVQMELTPWAHVIRARIIAAHALRVNYSAYPPLFPVSARPTCSLFSIVNLITRASGQ